MQNVFRIKGDASNPARLIDEYTGKAPVLIKGGQYLFEIGLFQRGRLVKGVHPSGGAGIYSVTWEINDDTATLFSGASALSIGGGSYGFINRDLTYEQWATSAAELFSFTLTPEQTSALPVTARLRITASGKEEGESVQSTGIFVDAKFATVIGVPALTSIPDPTPSGDFYTKTQSDARYGTSDAVLDLETEVTEINSLEASQPRLTYAVPTVELNASQKVQARSNIGAESALSHATTTGALDFAAASNWNGTLAAALTLTTSGTIASGRGYVLHLAQNATGGFNVTWPAGWTINHAATINPTPSAATQFIATSHYNGSATVVQVDPLRKLPPEPEPCYRFDLRQRNRLTIASGNLTSAADPYSGLVSTIASGTQAYTANGLSSGPCVTLTGTTNYWLGATATPAPLDATLPRGISVAVVFTSGTASDACLLHLGPLGLGLYQRGGNLEFGSASSTSARVAIPFTPNDSTPTLAIFSFTPGTGCAGVVMKSGAARAVNYSASAAAGTTTTNYEIGQTQGGTARLTGKLGHIAIYDRALTWPEVQALLSIRCADFSIT